MANLADRRFCFISGDTEYKTMNVVIKLPTTLLMHSWSTVYSSEHYIVVKVYYTVKDAGENRRHQEWNILAKGKN